MASHDLHTYPFSCFDRMSCPTDNLYLPLPCDLEKTTTVQEYILAICHVLYPYLQHSFSLFAYPLVSVCYISVSFCSVYAFALYLLCDLTVGLSFVCDQSRSVCNAIPAQDSQVAQKRSDQVGMAQPMGIYQRWVMYMNVQRSAKARKGKKDQPQTLENRISHPNQITTRARSVLLRQAAL